jgi:nicotinate-nucleotide--dimethylbenzimidazole phosphoribosyltransferase
MAEYGGFEIAAMAGAMLGAVTLQPGLRENLVFAHRSAEQGHAALLTALGAKPLLDLGLRLGEGSGALLAWPLLHAAAAMLNEMASFESAAVSGPA